MYDQPSWRLDAERNTKQEDDGWDHLHSYWNHPTFAALLVRVCSAHAGTPDAAEVNENLHISSKEASERCRGELSLINWDEWLDDADGEVGENSTDTELDPFLGRNLDCFGSEIPTAEARNVGS